MELFALSGLINAITSFAISALVIARNKKSIINKTFSLFALSVAIWSFGYWRWLSAINAASAMFWIKFFTFGSILIPAFYWHWILSLLEVKNKKRCAWLIQFVYGISVLLIILLFSTDQMILGTTQRLFFTNWPVPGTLYILFIAIYLAVIVYSSILIFNRLKSSTDKTTQKQLLFVLLGTLIGFGGGATNFFLWYDIPVLPYGNILVSIAMFFWGYAAAKYHLFNIKAIAAEILTFTIWVAVLVRLLLAHSLQDRLVESGFLVLVVVLGIMIIRSVLKEIEQKEQLIELDRLKSEFLSFASHQVKAPMAIIKGYSSLISEGSFGKIPGKVKETAIKIQEVTDRTIRLVTNFLDLRKIEEGKMKYQFAEIDIVDLVKGIVEELTIMARNKGLDLSCKLPNTPIRIKADEEKLRQVIMNLVENAIKYTEKGFVTVELSVEKNSVLISVSDSGYGISKELLPNLFKRFSRDSKTAKEIRGTGLGLYIAKEIINAHHGKIWAESEGEGKGSRFIAKLPK